jgi:hypothetical protein
MMFADSNDSDGSEDFGPTSISSLPSRNAYITGKEYSGIQVVDKDMPIGYVEDTTNEIAPSKGFRTEDTITSKDMEDATSVNVREEWMTTPGESKAFGGNSTYFYLSLCVLIYI